MINVFKKASTQIKTESFKSVCKIISYDSEKAGKDYNIFSTMYRKRKIISIPPFILLFFYFTCCVLMLQPHTKFTCQ